MHVNIEPFTTLGDTLTLHHLCPKDGILYMPDCQYFEDHYNNTITPRVISHSEQLKQQLIETNHLEYLDIKIPNDSVNYNNIVDYVIPILQTIPKIDSVEIGNLNSFNRGRVIYNSEIKHNIQRIANILDIMKYLNWVRGGKIMAYVSSHVPLTLDELQPLLNYKSPVSYSVSIKYVYDSYDDMDVTLYRTSPPQAELNGDNEVEFFDPHAIVRKD